MIKATPSSSEPAPALPLATSPKPFPSSALIITSVLSCFLATAAFVSSFTQVSTYWAYSIVPSTIGFLATVPYHVYMYISAQQHRRSPAHSDPIFITPIWIIYGFLLISLWAVIFIINILFCVQTEAPGVIIATIWSGMEWIILLFISLKCVQEIRRVEVSDASIAENDPNSAEGSDETTRNSSPAISKQRPAYLISFVLCTLTLVFSVWISAVCLVNVITFFLTAPHHIALYISCIRPNSPPIFPPTSVPYTFLLAALWCGVFILDILVSPFLYQKILLGIFGGMECIVIAYLAVRSVLDSFADGQIKL